MKLHYGPREVKFEKKNVFGPRYQGKTKIWILLFDLLGENIQPELTSGLLPNFSSLIHRFYELLWRRVLVDLFRLSHLRWDQDLWFRSGLVVYCLRSFQQHARISSFLQSYGEVKLAGPRFGTAGRI